jgi:hypothetical protein
MKSGFTKADYTYVVGMLPQYHWSISGNDLIKSEWLKIRIEKHNEGVMLSYANSLDKYYYRFLAECVDHISKMAHIEQMRLNLYAYDDYSQK